MKVLPNAVNGIVPNAVVRVLAGETLIHTVYILYMLLMLVCLLAQ